MKDASTSTEDLYGVVPKLINELTEQDSIIEKLNIEIYRLEHKSKFKKTLDCLNIYFIYTLPWTNFRFINFKKRFYKSGPTINSILLKFTKNQINFVYDVYCSNKYSHDMELFYYVNLFEETFFI